MHLFLRFYHYIWPLLWGCGIFNYSCCQSNHECLKTYQKLIILYSICYVEIQPHIVSKFLVLIYIFFYIRLYSICYVEIQPHRVSKFHLLMYIGFFLFYVICIPIKSHQSNQTCSTTLRRFIRCQYSSYFFVYILWLTIVTVLNTESNNLAIAKI